MFEPFWNQLYFLINRRANDSRRFDGIVFTNRFPGRIANTKDESTLVRCVGQPSILVVHLRLV